MTTTGGVVLNPAFPYEFEAHPPPPPAPPAPPQPPLAPPPAPPTAPPLLYRALNVTQRFKVTGESSEAVVEELQAQIKDVKEAVRTFLTNVTRTAAASIDTDVAVLWHDHDDEESPDEPHLVPNSTAVHVPNGSAAVHTPGNGTENASNATNSSAPADSARRLEHDGCENGARLDVAIVFEEDVTLGVIEAIREEWPALANFTQGVEACEEADFDPTASDSRPDSPADRSATVLIVSMGVGAAVLCCCACCVFFLAGRRRRRREEDYEEKNGVQKSDGAETTSLMAGEMPLLALAQSQFKETQLTFRMAKF